MVDVAAAICPMSTAAPSWRPRGEVVLGQPVPRYPAASTCCARSMELRNASRGGPARRDRGQIEHGQRDAWHVGHESSSLIGVPVRRALEAETVAQRVAARAITERASSPQLGDQRVDDDVEVGRQTDRAGAGSRRFRPRAMRRAHRPAPPGSSPKISASDRSAAPSSSSSRSFAASPRRDRRRGTRGGQRRPAAAGPSARRVRSASRTCSMIVATSTTSCGVMNTTSALRAASSIRNGRVRQHHDERLALRRSWRDRRAPDREVLTLEVDVVELVAVDEPARRPVADLGIVLPAVPQPPGHLDRVGRLVEQQTGGRLGVSAGLFFEYAGSFRRPKWSSSERCLSVCTRHPARPRLT